MRCRCRDRRTRRARVKRRAPRRSAADGTRGAPSGRRSAELPLVSSPRCGIIRAWHSTYARGSSSWRLVAALAGACWLRVASSTARARSSWQAARGCRSRDRLELTFALDRRGRRSPSRCRPAGPADPRVLRLHALPRRVPDDAREARAGREGRSACPKACSVVLVSVDPERDTPRTARDVRARVRSEFIGLTGDRRADRQAGARIRRAPSSSVDLAAATTRWITRRRVFLLGPRRRVVALSSRRRSTSASDEARIVQTCAASHARRRE